AIEEVDSRQVRTVIEINTPVTVDELVRHLNHLRRLSDLERERDIGDARHARLEAICDRILGSIFVIRLPLGQGGGQIWNLAISRIDDRALSRMNSVGSF